MCFVSGLGSACLSDLMLICFLSGLGLASLSGLWSFSFAYVYPGSTENIMATALICPVLLFTIMASVWYAWILGLVYLVISTRG